MAKMAKRKGTRRRSQRGGGAGIGGYTLGGPITPGAPIGNTAEVVPMDSCNAVSRFGLVSASTGQGTGLPGMRGGKRSGSKRSGSKRSGSKRSGSKRSGSKRSGTKRKAQRGGRYGFDLSSQVAPAAPWAGGIPPVQRIPCEASRPNPLNHVQSGGVGGVDSAYYAAPTAGYSNMPSSWVGSTGAPALVQQPYDARSLNPACLKTGGGLLRRSRHRRGSRKH